MYRQGELLPVVLYDNEGEENEAKKTVVGTLVFPCYTPDDVCHMGCDTGVPKHVVQLYPQRQHHD